jgi:diketogulonate reductase-like aldo/keto reductase
VVLCKSRTPERLKENIELGFELSGEQLARLKGRERCRRSVRPMVPNGFGDEW